MFFGFTFQIVYALFSVCFVLLRNVSVFVTVMKNQKLGVWKPYDDVP